MVLSVSKLIEIVFLFFKFVNRFIAIKFNLKLERQVFSNFAVFLCIKLLQFFIKSLIEKKTIKPNKTDL